MSRMTDRWTVDARQTRAVGECDHEPTGPVSLSLCVVARSIILPSTLVASRRILVSTLLLLLLLLLLHYSDDVDSRSVLRQRPETTMLRDSGEEPALRRTDDGPSHRDSVATSADREGVGAVEQSGEVDLRRR